MDMSDAIQISEAKLSEGPLVRTLSYANFLFISCAYESAEQSGHKLNERNENIYLFFLIHCHRL